MAMLRVHMSGFFSLTTATATMPTTSSTRPITAVCYFKNSKIRTHKSNIVLSTHSPNYIPNHIQDPHRVRIYDTTLREGEQAPGASMTPTQKLTIARQLSKLGVDIIEVGFPASNKVDQETIKVIAREVGNAAVNDDGRIPVICVMARALKDDIDKAWEAVKDAKYPRILTFIATSDIHMQHKLHMSRQEVIEKARNMVAYARSLGCNDVEFGLEDAGRYIILYY